MTRSVTLFIVLLLGACASYGSQTAQLPNMEDPELLTSCPAGDQGCLNAPSYEPGSFSNAQ
jgi:hypothetical protein